MEERVVRMRIHPHLYKRYKIICTEKGLSLPRQTAELIRKFVDIQEENLKVMGL